MRLRLRGGCGGVLTGYGAHGEEHDIGAKEHGLPTQVTGAVPAAIRQRIFEQGADHGALITKRFDTRSDSGTGSLHWRS